MALKLATATLISVCTLSLQATSHAAIPFNDVFSMIGDARTGYYAIHRDDRDNSSSSKHEWRLRLRPGVHANINESFTARLRFAGRYTSMEGKNDAHSKLYSGITPGKDGLKMGQSTLDEAWLNYKQGRWSLRAGRMQTKFELTGVAKKSLDRNNSPNTDIAWTDGLYFKHKGTNGWTTHAILQYNPANGATEVRRLPLDFTDNSSRASYFLAYEKLDKKATIVQQGLDITYLPAALQTDGSASGPTDDYLAFVGRMAAQWPMGDSGMKFLLGGELGYAPNTPTLSALNLGTSGNTGGKATQVTFNFIDIMPNHSLGIVLARAEGGWLLSPDFKSNQNLFETRYRWSLDKRQRIEVRLRYRTDIKQRTDKTEKRIDRDLYARYTLKF